MSPSTCQSTRPGLTRRGLAPLQPGAAVDEDRRRRSSAARGGGHEPALRAHAGRHPHLSAPLLPGVSITDAPVMHGLLVRPGLLPARLEVCRRRPPSHSRSPRPAAAFAPARLLTGGPSARASCARGMRSCRLQLFSRKEPLSHIEFMSLCVNRGKNGMNHGSMILKWLM